MVLKAADLSVYSLALVELASIESSLQFLQFISSDGKFAMTNFESIVFRRIMASGDSNSSLYGKINSGAIEYSCGCHPQIENICSSTGHTFDECRMQIRP